MHKCFMKNVITFEMYGYFMNKFTCKLIRALIHYMLMLTSIHKFLNAKIMVQEFLLFCGSYIGKVTSKVIYYTNP